MPEIVAHIVAAKRQHCHRIPSQVTQSTFRRRSRFGSQSRPEVNPVIPIEGLVNQRYKSDILRPLKIKADTGTPSRLSQFGSIVGH